MPRFIAIEGVIGAGKTTLALHLAARLDAALLLEKPADNPFLERFYADAERYALATQMTFLFERVDQCRAAAQPQLFNSRLVSDFLFDKDQLFARQTLSDSEYALYTQVFDHLHPQVVAPDCVIYLRAPVALLQERIAQRGLAMEQAITDDYLQGLVDAYAEFFARYRAAPVITIDVELRSPLTNAAHFSELLAGLETLGALSSQEPPP